MKNLKYFFLVGFFLIIIFAVGATQAILELRAGDRPQAFDLFSQPPSQTHLRTFEKELEEASWFAQQSRPWMQYAVFAVLRDPGENAVLGRNDWLFYNPGVEYLIEPMPSFGQTGDPVSSIVSFRDRLAARGVHLLVLPAPGKASIYPEMLTQRAQGMSGKISRHTHEIIARLHDAEVAVVDLFSGYADSGANPDRPYYLARDTHWSPEGMAIAAHATAQRLLALGWLAKGAVVYDLKPVTVSRAGDVLRMMKAPRIEQSFPPDVVACSQVVRRDTNALYEDDPGSEVLVLGDSFLRIYQHDEPGHAGFIAHLARELATPVASIVNDGGASTLVRQELNRKSNLLKNKKVVVWEFVERDIRFGAEGWQDVPLPPQE